MDRREFIAAAGSFVAFAPASQAFAQMGGAFLDHAVPGVGLTVSGSPSEIKLYFTMGVIAASSSVLVMSSHRGHGCGQQAGQRSFRAAHCDRQAQTRAAARHL